MTNKLKKASKVNFSVFLFFLETVENELLTSDEFQVPDFDNPFQELFLWAVLLNRQEMAKILWKGGKVPSICIHLRFSIIHGKFLLQFEFRIKNDNFPYLIVNHDCHISDLPFQMVHVAISV